MMIRAIVFDAYGTLYDIQAVAGAAEAAFPGFGDNITQIWRLKQLEYTWLRSMMGRYQDFWEITKDALAFTLSTLGLQPDPTLVEKIAETYNHLDPYPEAEAALQSLSDYPLAILSNGSPGMLQMLTSNSGMDQLFRAIMSVHSKRVFKPDPRAYELVEETLGLPPEEILFVSSNGFDVAGAKSFGFNVARIKRITQRELRGQSTKANSIGPSDMFKMLRSQAEHIGFQPDFVLNALSDLAKLATTGFAVVR